MSDRRRNDKLDRSNAVAMRIFPEMQNLGRVNIHKNY